MSAFLPSRREVEAKITRVVEEAYQEKTERLEAEYEKHRRAIEERFRSAAERFEGMLK